MVELGRFVGRVREAVAGVVSRNHSSSLVQETRIQAPVLREPVVKASPVIVPPKSTADYVTEAVASKPLPADLEQQLRQFGAADTYGLLNGREPIAGKEQNRG